MLWSSTPKLELSVADTKAVVLDALAKLESKLGHKVYVTSTGLVTSPELAKEVLQTLDKGKEQTTADLIAVDLDVDKDAIQEILDQNSEALRNVYIDSVILPRQLVAVMVGELEKEAAEPIDDGLYCQQKHISMKLLNWLCSQSDKVLHVDHVLVDKASFEARKQLFLDALAAATAPTALETVERSEVLRKVLVNQLAATVPGSIDRTTELFTPKVYVQQQRERSLDDVKKHGYLTEKDLAGNGIKDPAKFARKYDLVNIPGFVLTPEYLETHKQTAKQLLEDRGFLDVGGDLELGDRLLPALELPQKYSTGYTRFLMRPSFETKCKSLLAGLAAEKGSADAQQLSVNPGEKAKELISRLAGKAPNNRDTAATLAETYDVPEKLAAQMAARLTDAARQQYFEAANEVVQTSLDGVQRQVDLKIAVYLNGLLTLSEPLLTPVFSEWQQYVSECNSLPAANIEQAKTDYLTEPSEQDLAEAAEPLIANQKKKLQAAADPALVLHLAVVVYHAQHFVPGQTGCLKIRGKHVPKIIKAFDFPPSFAELKTAVTGKTPEDKARAKDLAEQVKGTL